MKKTEKIIHEGVIIDIDSEYISIEVGIDGETKVIQVENRGDDLFENGEKVNVLMKKSFGANTVWISYLTPLVLALIMITLLSSLRVGELSIGLGILAILAIYYCIVYLLGDKIKKDFVCTVEKLK